MDRRARWLTQSSRRYKARGAYEDILPYLDECHAAQVEKGLVGAEEKKSNFPY